MMNNRDDDSYSDFIESNPRRKNSPWGVVLIPKKYLFGHRDGFYGKFYYEKLGEIISLRGGRRYAYKWVHTMYGSHYTQSAVYFNRNLFIGCKYLSVNIGLCYGSGNYGGIRGALNIISHRCIER